MNSILAKKVDQGQKFLENGLRIPVTKLNVGGNIVVAIKTPDRDKYSAVQLGFDKRTKKIAPKSNRSPYNFLREVRMADADVLPAVGDIVKATEVFQPGDIINVMGISKGKGYAGAVKLHHFKGGPRTHGQSDRERAPGAIGSTTTPGRVYRGKRMAGRMGQERVTVKNLRIMSVDDDFVLVKGLVPGSRNTLLMVEKTGKDKKFVPLFAEKIETKAEVKIEAKQDEKIAEPAKTEGVKQVDIKTETKAEIKEEAK
jgi:large subunit ribosomal protein L3